MKHSFTRAALAAVITLAAAVACSDYSATPTGTYASRTDSTTTSPTASYLSAKSPRVGFGFNGTASGFPLGAVFLTGGGSYDPATASNVVDDSTTDVHSGGGFRCIDAVGQGPLLACGRDEGVRWDTVQLLASAPFKCTVTDVAKTAVTGPDRVVLKADFYRAGDGNDESFTAQMIVSETDLAPNIPGNQTLWIQGVGCAEATTNFNR
jgi:hypothetical protein